MSESNFVRGTVITALKYTISDQPHSIDGILSKCIGDFMVAISDQDLVGAYVQVIAAFMTAFRMFVVLLLWLLIQLLIISLR